MNVTITPQIPLGGSIRAISSKSDLHRLLIAASLCKEPTDIFCNTLSADIVATISCLNSLGANIKPNKVESGYSISVCADDKAKKPSCDCNESGTTLRLLTPLAATAHKNVTFVGKGRLAERPMEPLLSVMKAHGAKFTADTLPFTVKGTLKPGDYHIAGNVSSQFISGLMFALPLLKKQSRIVIEGKLESAPYVDMTISTLKIFGLNIIKVPLGFLIEGEQQYHSPSSIDAEGDWSNAAFWLAAGAIGASVTVEGLKYPDTLQGDRVIINLLERFGAKTSYTESGAITVSPGRLKGLAIDISQCPDLAPILAVVAAFAEGTTVLTGAGRLRLKESDRMAATVELIENLGGVAKAQEDNLVIEGGGLHGGCVDSHNDHRLAMAAAVAGTATKHPVTIKDAGAVSKSYPNFFDDFKLLGGEYNVF